MRQKRILLGFVEAVDFIDEEDGSRAAKLTAAFRGGDDLLDFLDPRRHGADGHELGAGDRGQQPAERRLSGAGRSPEDQRMQRAVAQRLTQRPSRAEELRLPYELVKG